MLLKSALLSVIFGLITLTANIVASWNKLNCPAPRSPENGLSFIFRNGELVHFRCHPGFYMRGRTVAYCVNNEWTAPVPECLPIPSSHSRQENSPGHFTVHDDSNYYNYQRQSQTPKNEVQDIVSSRRELNGKLFNWDNTKNNDNKGVYGDGPRRLPLINGIWPSKPLPVVALGPQSTPGPPELVRDEVNIAELRHKQFQEVVKQRLSDSDINVQSKKKRKGKKRKNRKLHKNSVISEIPDNAPRENVIALGSTEDGDALSVSFSKLPNSTSLDGATVANHHKYRHRDIRKKKRKGKGKKFRNPQPYYSPNVIARASRVDTSGLAPYPIRYHNKRQQLLEKHEIAELRRRPVELVKTQNESGNISLSTFDTSCVESLYGREVPMIAPQLENSFVYRYETKKNRHLPYNSYMQVRYRCLSGYSFHDTKQQILHCREAQWVGEFPQCVKNSA